MDKESLQKLTVAQLREKLKGRHLQMTGTKVELVERLLESYQEEENLLAGTEENDSLDDVDDLLGSNNLEKSALTSNEEALLLGLPSKVNVPKTTESTTQKVDPKPVSSNVTSPAKPQETVKKPEITSPPVDQSGEAKSSTETVPKTTRQPIRPKIAVESAVTEDARKRRAERFGLPVKAEAGSEKKPAESEPKAAVVSEKHPISLNSNSKLLERAKRFGLPVQADDDKETNGASKAKIPKVSVVETDSKKQARLQRFAS